MKKILLPLLLIVFIQTGCGNGGIKEEAHTQRPGEFKNGQLYATFKIDNFQMNYPNWPNFDTSKAADADKYKLAVANEGCSFIIKVSPVPSNISFKDYAENALQEGTKLYPTKILIKDVKDTFAHFEGEISMSNVIMKSVTYAYFTGKKESVSVGLVARKDQFDQGCTPIMDEAISSVKVDF
ncbi:MAG: hypothetical protein WC843_05695 [Candidatus Gracilibacteria bacterium]|jgi:hypothetical protein